MRPSVCPAVAGLARAWPPEAPPCLFLAVVAVAAGGARAVVGASAKPAGLSASETSSVFGVASEGFARSVVAVAAGLALF